VIVKRDDDLMSDLYYFWWRYVQYKKQERSLEKINSHFNRMLAIFEVKYSHMAGKWNGQTKAEFEKNYKRVKDIVDKSAGDEDKAVALSRTQAGRISDEFKAINRAMAAKSMKEEHIFEVFFQRAYELGSVSKQEYREYKLEKLGI
jgi:hypothetical protein